MLSAVGFSQTQMAFPDLSKARGASRRVAALLDRVPAVDGDAPGIELGPRRALLAAEEKGGGGGGGNDGRALEVVAVASSSSASASPAPAAFAEISDAAPVTGAATSSSSSPPATNALVVVPCLGQVDFRSVRFAYPSRRGAPVLSDFSLSVRAGDTVALVGPSGGGKSTVLSLLLRFYDVDAGIVELDGSDVRSLALSSLRSRVALVAQEPVMFTGTIRDNVVYGLEGFGGANLEEEKDTEEVVATATMTKKRGLFSSLLSRHDKGTGDGADEEAAAPAAVLSSLSRKKSERRILEAPTATKVSDGMLRAALVAANAAEFVDRAPRGVDTRLGQGDGGVQLSGGQKKRLAVARALLRDPAVLLLDEATSALDAASEAAVVAALERASEGRTTLVVAHRLSTVAKSDCLAYVSGGRVAEKGTHQELLAAGGAYAALVTMNNSSSGSGGSSGSAGAAAVEGSSSSSSS